MQTGDRVRIVGDHPHSGKLGVYVEDRRTIFGMRPVVKADDGDEFFVMDPAEWVQDVPPEPSRKRNRGCRRLPYSNPAYCPKCGGARYHSRLKGYRCRSCDE